MGVFWKLLFKWRGSVYKLVWQNLSLYILLYYSLSFSYRFILNESGRVGEKYFQFSNISYVYIRQEKFEQVTVHCQRFADLIPVTFVLGFYVRCVGGGGDVQSECNCCCVAVLSSPGGGASTRSYPGRTPAASSSPPASSAMMTGQYQSQKF